MILQTFIERGRVVAFCAATLLALPATAATPPDGDRDSIAVHLAAQGFGAWPGRVDFGNSVGRDGQIDLARGAAGGVQLARDRGRWRYEIEFQQGRSSLQGIRLGTLASAADGHASHAALTGNVYRAFDPWDRLQLRVGVGAGWGRVTLPRAGFDGGCQCFAGTTAHGLALQARAVAEWTLDSGGRPFVQLGVLSLAGGDGGQGPVVRYRRDQAWQLGVGWRHAF
ncbi:MAG: hypothetical protein U1F56_05830 [Rubrivivax sp.]